MRQENVKSVIEFFDVLREQYGYTLSETEQSVLDGSSPLYTKEEDDA